MMARAHLALLAAAGAAIAVIAVPVPGFAQNGDEQGRSILVHTVRRDDSLQLLAAEYYADRRYAVFIMFMNGMSHPRPLRPGERLKIPTAWKYSAVAQETCDMLAERFLGDGRRGAFLAEVNSLAPDESLALGQEVQIPFHIRYTADSNETLRAVAATFYGDSRKADLLRAYNFKSGGVLKKGETVIVPITEVQVRPEKLPAADPEEKKREQRRKEMTERVGGKLRRARDAWTAGEYGVVRAELEDLDVEYLEDDKAVAVAFLRGCAFVAIGDEAFAKANFEKVLGRSPDFRVHARDVSPKIRQVWERAGGKVDK